MGRMNDSGSSSVSSPKKLLCSLFPALRMVPNKWNPTPLEIWVLRPLFGWYLVSGGKDEYVYGIEVWNHHAQNWCGLCKEKTAKTYHFWLFECGNHKLLEFFPMIVSSPIFDGYPENVPSWAAIANAVFTRYGVKTWNWHLAPGSQGCVTNPSHDGDSFAWTVSVGLGSRSPYGRLRTVWSGFLCCLHYKVDFTGERLEHLRPPLWAFMTLFSLGLLCDAALRWEIRPHVES